MTAPAPHEVVRRLRTVAGEEAQVPLHAPLIGDLEEQRVADCLKSGWVSTVGPLVGEFEQSLSALHEGRPAVACVTGTAALRLALEIAGVGRDAEVLMPALTFVATANAAAHLGAVPHFLDVEEATLGLDPQALRRRLETVAERRDGRLVNRESGRRLAAVLPMHCFGHPVEMEALCIVAADFGLPVVEDATESLGSRYRGRPCGTLAPIAALSFNGNKIVTTGGGGAVICADEGTAQRVRHLGSTAKLPHRWAFLHDRVGYNDRLPNLNAALGLAQLQRLPAMLAAKRRLNDRYAEAFADLPGARLFREAPGSESNHWLNALILDAPDESALEALLTASNDAGLMTRPAWTPLHRLPMYAAAPRAPLPVTESLAARILNLPSSATLELARG